MRRPHITRFAPSPTGLLHRGHAYSAVIGWAIARITGGQWHLRIEDIDTGRSRPEFMGAIEEDLRWLGLDWDGPVVIQSANRPRHLAVLQGLVELGWVYRCRCTRADIARLSSAPHAGETIRYPGFCRDADVADGEDYALRLNLSKLDLPANQTWQDVVKGVQSGNAHSGGDPVLMRKDGAIAYHLACGLDDADAHITLITRGEDLEEATPLQRLLQQLLGLSEPAYLHHGLLLDENGRRLAKRDKAQTLRSLREGGVSGMELRAELLNNAKEMLIGAGFPAFES